MNPFSIGSPNPAAVRGDYRPPAPDRTPTRLKITRPCLVDSIPQPAGATLTIERWKADLVISAGRGALA